MTKRGFRVLTEDIYWDINGVSLKKVLEVVQNRIEQYGEDSTLDICGEDVEIRILFARPETDEEYERRVSEEQRYQAERAEQERVEYERLKAKFGENK